MYILCKHRHRIICNRRLRLNAKIAPFNAIPKQTPIRVSQNPSARLRRSPILLPSFPPLNPLLPQRIVQQQKLPFALHHHNALLPQLIYHLGNGIHDIARLIQIALLQLTKQPIKRNKRTRSTDSRAAMHNARTALRRIHARRFPHQRHKRRLVVALRHEKVGPPGKQKMHDAARLAGRGNKVHLADGAAGGRVPAHGGERDAREQAIGELGVSRAAQLQRRRVQVGRVVREALLAAGLVGLGEHDDDGRVGALVPQHAPDVGHAVLLGALRRDEVFCGAGAGAQRRQPDRRRVDVVAVAGRHAQPHAVVLERVHVEVAVAFEHRVARDAGPLRGVVGRLRCHAFGEALALQPLEVRECVVQLCGFLVSTEGSTLVIKSIHLLLFAGGRPAAECPHMVA